MSKIYGWSWKSPDDQYMIAFDDEESAQSWLHTEEYDFRERELLTEEEAIELIGSEQFLNWDEGYPYYWIS